MWIEWFDGFWTLQGNWRWLGNINGLAPPPLVGLIVTLAAVLCGFVIGAERERAEKPAGMRTLTLICLGAVMFTQASLLIAGDRADPGRIAAQVVTGVGFLGAGAIIRERGLVIGVTTGAAIWAMAAIGVVIGSGYVAAGLAFTLVVLLTLLGVRRIEHAIGGPCEWETVWVRCAAEGGKTRAMIQAVVEEYDATVVAAAETAADGTCEMTIRYCRAHRQHKALRTRLAGMSAVRELRPGGTA